MKNTGILLSIALAAVLLALVAFSIGDPEPKLAPDFRLLNLNGEEVVLSQFRGNVVVLDFWATWCAPCLRSFPDLHDLVARYEDRGVFLLVVSLDKSEARARDYLIEHGYPTENVLWESLDAARGVKALFGVVGIPKTFIVDREGYIQYSGSPSNLTEDELLNVL